MNVHNYKVFNNSGEEILLKEYAGKVILIVNTATECGFTPQYEDLQKLYEEYREKGLEILDFPCNQFGGQAPGTDTEIDSFCSMNFGTKFPRFKKIDVKGDSADPLFKDMVSEKPFKSLDKNHKIGAILHDMFMKEDKNYENNPEIKWNFTKFLIDKEGNLIERFEPTTDMSVIEEKIKELL